MLFPRRTPKPDPAPSPAGPPRTLFLDDDPQRAAAFAAARPGAVWVTTAEECRARLEEPWDEVHLDHDLGGEHFVDQSRDDCGMEVVRWLSLHPRPHLRGTRFFVHSHNPAAATMMAMQMMLNGYRVEVRPFGAPPEPALPPPEAFPTPDLPRVSLLSALRYWLRGVFRRRPPGGLGGLSSDDAFTRFRGPADPNPPA
jgi:hypothetical protein